MFCCPHCQQEHNGLEYIDISIKNGKLIKNGKFEICCDGCEKDFQTEFSIAITFKTKIDY